MMRGIGRLKTRVGRCYELAGRLAQVNFHEPGILLVHGDTRSADPRAVGGRMDHAWVEVGELVYDRTCRDNPFDRTSYYADGEVSNIVKYSPHDAAIMISEYQHWGPWLSRSG